MVGNVPSWIIEALSKEQIAPIESQEKYKCVLAGAGSGKTRTLVHSIAADLANGVPPQNIIAFTFTEKSANELFLRIHSLTQKHLKDLDLESMFIGTIHGWCHNFLLEQDLFYNFEVIDELQLDALVSRMYDLLELEKVYSKSFPKAIPNFLADMEIFFNEHLEITDVPEILQNPLAKFLQVLQENRLLSFGGMIRHATVHLENKGPLNNLGHLYVDEYQDVNPAQVNLVKAMLASDSKLTVFGDDLQCIYNWRGSDVKRILTFDSDFKPSKIFHLRENYRSRPDVLKFADNIASNIILRDTQKHLIPKRNCTDLDNVQWISTPDEREQTNDIAEIVTNFLSQGVPANKIAIPLRSVFGSGQPIVEELQNRGIPVYCPQLSRGGGFMHTFLMPIFAI